MPVLGDRQTVVLGLPDRATYEIRRLGAAQVDDRASRRGHCDAEADGRDRLCQVGGAMKPDARSSLAPTGDRHRHMHGPLLGFEHPPQLGGASMAQRRAHATGQNPRNPSPLIAQPGMPHRVHPSGDPVQSPCGNPSLDGI
jgi:hypothetical protein